jgi:hypothetical protein
VFRQKNSTATPSNATRFITLAHVYDSVVRTVHPIGSQPFHEISPKSVRIALPLPRFIPYVFLGYNNSRPMFPLSFRLVLASHFTLTITFALIVQRLKVTRPNFIQHVSIQNFRCITPFCSYFFSSYCFTVAYFIPPVSTCSREMVFRVDH